MSDTPRNKTTPKLMIIHKNDPKKYVIYGLAKLRDEFILIAQPFTVCFSLDTPESYIAEYLCWRCTGQEGEELSVISNFELRIPEFVYAEEKEQHKQCREDLIHMIKFIKYCTNFDVTDEYTKRIESLHQSRSSTSSTPSCT